MNQNSAGIFEKRSYLIFALLVLVILTFSPVMSAHYLFFDEHVAVLGNSAITAPLSLDSFVSIFSSFEPNIYTPLSIASHWLEYNLFGFNSAVSHFINLLLHLACAVMVFLVAEALVSNLRVAFIVAGIWAVHPVQVESVAWVLERRNLLYGLFFFASLAAYLRYLKSFRALDMAAATAFMVISGLSKNLAFFLPAAWLMLDWLKSRRLTRAVFVEKLPGFLVALGFLSLMIFGVHSGASETSKQSFNWLIASYNVGFYVVKTLLPTALAPIYEINAGSAGLFSYGPLFLLVTLVAAVLICRKDRLAVFAALFYLFNILPLSGIVVVGYRFYAVLHFLYVALFGIILCLAVAFCRTLRSSARMHLFMPVGIVLIIWLSVISFQYCQIWSNSRALFEYALEIDPDNRFARNQLGVFLENNRDYYEAAKHYQELIKRYPAFFGGYYGLGRIYRREGQNAAAIELFSKALKVNQKRADLPLDRGMLLLGAGDFSTAESDFSMALQYNYSNLGLVHFWRSEARRRQGNYSGAIADLLLAAAENKDDFSLKVGLIELFVESGQISEAAMAFISACGQVTENPQQWLEYLQIICSPSFAAVLQRSTPYRNFFRSKFNWHFF
ncbi:MAG TPA: hypothetical protein DCG57_13620 [Candidatus Riflebacteria bacterium]|nr:hypothetical protein [Candidatus Riflebacteria bacterium]